LVEEILKYEGPVYMRLGRFAVPQFYTKGEREFKLGKGIVLAEGSDVTIVATGIMVAAAMEARNILKEMGINAAVIDIHTIKPIDRELILKYASESGNVVTAEEHSVIGGLGDAVGAILAETGCAKLKKLGINDVFGTSASASVLLEHYGLNAEGIVNKVKEILNK
ncbi:MAG: transketolase family protein, partial [Clostridiales bacterium]|nr:transketolase family protein [Candidatus Coliplasma equi]